MNTFYEKLVHSLRTDILELFLLPTEKCNFNCPYCYEEHVLGMMQPKLVEAIKKFISQKINNLTLLSIIWYGGEPLLAIPVIEDISLSILSIIHNKINFYYESMIITNGYLLDFEVAEHLYSFGVKTFQITFDGPQSLHDYTRSCNDGQGTFNKIWNNLITIKNSRLPIKIIIRIHFTPQNLKVMPDFIACVKNTFLGDNRFSIIMKSVALLGDSDIKDFKVIPKSFRPEIIKKIGDMFFDRSLRDPRIYLPDICHASRHNAFTIRPNGDVCKCMVSLNDPKNNIGHLRPNGSLELDEKKCQYWFRGWLLHNEKILACPAKGITH